MDSLITASQESMQIEDGRFKNVVTDDESLKNSTTGSSPHNTEKTTSIRNRSSNSNTPSIQQKAKSPSKPPIPSSSSSKPPVASSVVPPAAPTTPTAPVQVTQENLVSQLTASFTNLQVNPLPENQLNSEIRKRFKRLMKTKLQRRAMMKNIRKKCSYAERVLLLKCLKSAASKRELRGARHSSVNTKSKKKSKPAITKNKKWTYADIKWFICDDIEKELANMYAPTAVYTNMPDLLNTLTNFSKNDALYSDLDQVQKIIRNFEGLEDCNNLRKKVEFYLEGQFFYNGCLYLSKVAHQKFSVPRFIQHYQIQTKKPKSFSVAVVYERIHWYKLIANCPCLLHSNSVTYTQMVNNWLTFLTDPDQEFGALIRQNSKEITIGTNLVFPSLTAKKIKFQEREELPKAQASDEEENSSDDEDLSSEEGSDSSDSDDSDSDSH